MRVSRLFVCSFSFQLPEKLTLLQSAACFAGGVHRIQEKGWLRGQETWSDGGGKEQLSREKRGAQSKKTTHTIIRSFNG